MNLSRQIPWRKMKVLVLIVGVVLLVHTLWSRTSSRMIHEQRMSQLDDGKSVKNAPAPLEPLDPLHMMSPVDPRIIDTNDVEAPVHKLPVEPNKGGATCQKIVPFSEHIDGRISTYDLPAETDYSLDPKGRYKIPEEFYKKENDPLEEEINVILVPFSHADPGYGRTVEQYYVSMTKNVLDNMVIFLSANHNMTFQWAETVFLERWFQDIDGYKKQKVRELIAKGQLEIVLGGWVMPDEAITHYMPVVDQLIEGHQWLVENLGISPTSAWVNDPFGFSSTMPYLWKSSGIDNLVILRIHQAVKATLMRKRSLDFMWRPYWNSYGENDILCSLMPYQNYWNSDVCGPEQSVCKKFNFLHMGFSQGDQRVTSQNVDLLAKELYQAYKFTASLFKYNNIIIYLGEDNSYDNMQSWQDTYTNYEKLISYINARTDWKMKIKFGTTREYFENIRGAENHSGDKMKFPTVSGDFFPYSDKENDYWTGYFTTRPWMKRFTREVEPLVRAADRFSVMLYFHCVVKGACNDVSNVHKDILRGLRDARREVGIYQHHDGITGTSLPFVVDDYERRLLKAFLHAKDALDLSIVTILSNGLVKNPHALVNNNNKAMARDILQPNLHRFTGDTLKVIVANPMEKARTDTVTFYIEKREIESISNAITYQLSETNSLKYQNCYRLTVLVQLSPFELKTLVVKSGRTDGSNVSPYKEKILPTNTGTSEVVTIENKFMKVEFYFRNGSLKCIYDNQGRALKISSEYLKYTPKKSGAYLFGPDGPAKPIDMINPKVVVSTGPMYSQVSVEYMSVFTQKWVLYHTDDVKGRGLHLTQAISLLAHPSFLESEVILRFKTDISNGNIFFTDQNGYQLMGRLKNRDMPIETNYYPITSMALIEDESRRLTLHSAQSHGVSSLENGWLEVMLDRNMAHDDGKGLGMGATERIPTQAEFIIQIEYKDGSPDMQEPRYTNPSIESYILNEQLQNKPQMYSIAQQSDEFLESFNVFDNAAQFPCDTSIVSLRSLVSNDLNINGTSFVLHRRPTHCSFSGNVTSCAVSDGPFKFQDFNFGLDTSKLLDNVVETTLSHVHKIGNVKISDDIRPEVSELRSYLIKT
ncbi:hypothetical protein ACF0H5_021061 [Mactra antiquata]